MPGSRRFIGTIKSFFKSDRSEDGDSAKGTSVIGHESLYGDGSDATLSISECYSSAQRPKTRFWSGALSSAVETRKSLHRKLFPQICGNSGTTLQPSSAALQASPFYHSMSDPCDNPVTPCKPFLPQQSYDVNPSNKSPPEQPFKARASSQKEPTVVVANLKSTLRSDLTLSTLCNSSSSPSSFDLPSGASSTPVVFQGPGSKEPKEPPGVTLPSVEIRHCGARAPTEANASRRKSDVCGGVVLPEPTPGASKTTLLALCAGAPPEMRRRKWSLEDFDVTRKIYKGSTSAVYKATCRHSRLPVALKVYFLSHVPSNVVHMLVREIKIHAQIIHKNIIMLYAAFQDEKRLVLVQEYAARGDLYGIHRAMNRRITEAQLTTIVLAPFMDALSYLHSRGICHRDIKPENILFTADWRLVIADFGVSIDLNQERAVTRAGTLEYMAPEVARCPLKMVPEENKENVSLAYTTAVDIWAVGVLAYELLVGFPPFVANNPAANGGAGTAFLAAHATCKTLSFPASTSAQGRDFISLALAETPEERPTALQLCRHPWLTSFTTALTAAGVDKAQESPARRLSNQVGAVSGREVASRHGDTTSASNLSTGG